MISSIAVLFLVLDLVLVLPFVLAQSACSFAPDGTTPTGNGVCTCFESQNPKGWIVDCSRQSFTGVPTGLPAETVYLSLNENAITALSSTSLEGLSLLETLQIQNNGLRSDAIEDGAFANLGNLKSLDLSSNRIQLSQAMITHLLPLASLQTLTLANNNINTIHSSAVEIFDRVETLDLTSNAFVCDCELAWFRNWLINIGHLRRQVTGVVCASPTQYQRMQISTAGFCQTNICYQCSGGSDAECNNQPSAIQTCSPSQEACFNEIRVSNGVYRIQKSCKQLQACVTQLLNNVINCNEGTQNSVCQTCCIGDLCNGPASGILPGYTLPGFPPDPSLVFQTTTVLTTNATETTTVSTTTESTNKYTTINSDMITTFPSTPAMSSEATFIESTTVSATTSKNIPTTGTTSSPHDTSFPPTQTQPKSTTPMLQTTPSAGTTTPQTLTPLITDVPSTTEHTAETTLVQTQAPRDNTTPVTPSHLRTTPVSQTPTESTSLESKTAATSELASEFVSTISTPLPVTQEKSTELHRTNIPTTDSFITYQSETSSIRTPTSSIYPSTETTATSTTQPPVSPNSPSLVTTSTTDTTTAASSLLTTELVDKTSESVTTVMSTSLKETTTTSTTESTTSDTDTLTVPTSPQSTISARTIPTLPQKMSTNSVTTLPITTPVLDTSLPTSLSTTFELSTTKTSPNETPPRSTLPIQTTSSTSTIKASSTIESDKPQSTFHITTSPTPDTTPSTSTSSTPNEASETTLTTIIDTVQTLRNTPASPLTTLGTTPTRPGTTQTFTSTLDVSSLTTTQTSPSTSTPGTTLETAIPTTLPHDPSTKSSSSTSPAQEQTTIGNERKTSDSPSTSHTTQMSLPVSSTTAPQSTPSLTVNPTDLVNTISTPITHTTPRNPERTTFQYTPPTSTPTYSSTLMNTDPSTTSSSSVSTTLSTKAVTTMESSSVASTQSSIVTTASTTTTATTASTAQTSGSSSEAASPTSSSSSSTHHLSEGTTGSQLLTTSVERPLTTDSSVSHCPEETTLGEYGKITWLRTPGTETSEVACPYGNINQQSAMATRSCLMIRSAATWGEPDASSCATSTQMLKRLSEVPITPDNAQTVSKNLTTVTNSPMELNETDIDLAVDVLENLARSINEYDSTEVVENAVDAINNLAGTMMQTLVAGQQDAEVATRILHLIDEFALNVDFEGDQFDALSDGIDVVVVKINTEMLQGLSFQGVVDENGTSTPKLSFNNTDPQSSTEAQTSIELPGSLFETHQGETDRVQFVLYKNTIFFEVITEAARNSTTPTPEALSSGENIIERDALNSLVISASVGELKITGLRDPVKTTFVHQRPERADNPSCVFWDFQAAGGQGSWSSEGCIVSVTAEGSTQCECDHLTNFALLMDIYGTTTTFNEDHLMALSIITFAGCALSILGLIVTFFSYIMIRQLRHDRRTRVLLNLVVALTFMNILFLTDAVLTEFGNPGYIACKLLGALLHYGLLTSIAWMALEAWHMYLALVKVFDSYTSHLMKKMCVIGWGLPAVIVAVVIGIDLEHYDFYNEFCWLEVGGIPFYASFVAPALAVILFNFIIFSLVTNQLCSLRRRSVSASSEQFDVSAQLRASLSITVLLGLTWGLGIFMIGEASLVFSYLFAIFNSFQGFSIFVFHCLLKEEVRLGWRKLFCPQCLTLEELTKSSTGQNFSSSNKQAQLQKRMTIEYGVESNGRSHQSQAMPFNREHEVPRFNPFAAHSEFYQDSSI